MFRKLVLIDLDGVLNQYKGDYKPDYIPPIKKGAKDFLKFIIDYLNCEIKLFTSRPKELAKLWVIDNNLQNYIKDVTNIKEPSYLIIDDRCIKHINFENTINEIKKFKHS